MSNHNCNYQLLIRNVIQAIGFIAILPVISVAALNNTGITTCSNATQNGLHYPVAGFTGQDAEYD